MPDPSSATDRHYVRIRPSEEPIPVDRLTAQFGQLHEALGDATVEWLLVTERDAEEVGYYVGMPATTHTAVDRVLRRIFDGYGLEDVDGTPLPASITTAATDDTKDTPPVAAAEFQGVGERSDDWQTRLRPPTFADAPAQHETARVEAAPDLPLESLVEGMLAADGPVVYQALLRPRPDWSVEADDRVWKIEHREDTWSQLVVKWLFGEPDGSGHRDAAAGRQRDHHDEPRRDGGASARSKPGSRIAGILATSANHSFDVNARLVASGPTAEETVTDLRSAFGAVGGDYYRVTPSVQTGDDGQPIADAVAHGHVRDGDDWWTQVRHWFPLAGNHSPRIVADSTTVPHFCLLDGATLTDRAARALQAIPPDRTAITPPSDAVLDHLTGDGLPVGQLRLGDGSTTETTIALPPTLQRQHVAWYGSTGSGKTIAVENAVTATHAATAGADIVIDRKGDGMPGELMQSLYADQGSLDDVYYFDCASVVPAICFFSLQRQLDGGVPRSTAVSNKTQHYLDILREVYAGSGFDEATESQRVIRVLVTALFDATTGADAFPHRDLLATAREFQETGTPPAVGRDATEALFDELRSKHPETLGPVLSGATGRMAEVPMYDHLATMFNHVPTDEGPAFDLRALLDEDVTLVLDTGGVRPEIQRIITLVVLSELWTALRHRERDRAAADATGEPPLVNVYVEEAAGVADTGVVSHLLSQSRSFGLSLTLVMQFPGQLRRAAPDAYDEVMNNVGTVVVGNVPHDEELQTRLATAAMPPDDVGNRLRALSNGEWLVSTTAPFLETVPKPFMVESLPYPSGHPDGDDPLPDALASSYEASREAVAERTAAEYGLHVDASPAADADAATPPAGDAVAASRRRDSALPHTDRLPAMVDYDADAHALACAACPARFPPTTEGMRRAITCCHALDDVDRNNVPICEIPLTLRQAERAASDYTHQQLLFLQAVYEGMLGRFDELAYDLIRDSMIRLREYCGLDMDAVGDLEADGLLSHDTDRPHRLYTLTAAGREELRLAHKTGDAHGDGTGDLNESSLHRLLTRTGVALLAHEFVDDPASPATRTERYWSDGRNRLDAVALDDDGAVVAALEAELINNDVYSAVPADYDKMAAHEPAAALWLTKRRDDARRILAVLNDPADGDVRVAKTYSEKTVPETYSFDEPGCTDILTLRNARSLLTEED